MKKEKRKKNELNGNEETPNYVAFYKKRHEEGERI